MTRIILTIDTRPPATYITDDPRPVRELVKLINTGKLVVGLGEVNLGGGIIQQFAMGLPAQNTVSVMPAAPPVHLSPRMYDVLHLLAEGKTGEVIGFKLHLQPRTVSWYISQIRQRFGVNTREEAIVRATELGLL